MKKGQIISLAIAAACGVGALFVMSKFKPAPPPPQVDPTQTSMTKVLVARSDIGLGTLTTETNFRWQEYPEGTVPQGAISCAGNNACSMREYGGSIARVPILKEEIITRMKIVKAGEGGVLASILPQGMRAIAVPTKSDDTAVGRLILPNDHVDVILIRRMRGKGGQDEHVSDTLFRNVKVLAIGQRIEAAKADQKAAEGTTATLELSPRQAELLALAKSMGEITLALRSIADFKEDRETKDLKSDNRGNAIRVLRYGVKSRAYGVN